MEEDWENLFDFSIDDHVLLSLDSEFQQPFSTVVNPTVSEPANPSSDDGSDRVRKRDPRLTCENFLAGRIPCSCPEEDERDEEEEGVRKKRARVTVARCQVPGCEADISELKGYHKRHKVCLRCANAATVVLDGQAKRYCQQCGKFHILPDFDEDKRSCRRKLEKHNRRRRKSVESKSGAEDLQGNMLPEDAACDGDAGKDIFNGVSGGTDGFCLGNQIIDTETLLELESAHGSPFHNTAGQTNIGAQNIQSNSTLSSVASGEPQTDASIDNSRSALSSSLCANKTTYTSVCPTGRMSFKLYDWNPAEFPRRLRHQIFQWLSSMPVELEGYIRPGCTILTVFIAMPRFMWDELLGDAAAFLDDLISAPESLLSGRDNMLIYLNNAVFQVLEDGTSLIKRTMEMQAPRLHYVYPICFEVGKPMEFIACGSYLSQPKFRFLVSFAGKYLKYDYCLAIPHPKTVLCNGIKGDSDHGSNHQIFKIFIPPMETEIFGPAFIEVENESGISNFIPVLLGDGQICYELQMIQEKIGESFHPKNNGSQLMAMCSYSDSCAVLVSKQAAMSELLLDIGWLLKEPQSEKDETLFTLTQIQRLNRLLYFLIESSSVSILEKILQSLGNGVCIEEFHGPLNSTNDVDLKSFKKYLSRAREILHQNVQGTADSRTLLHSETTQASTLPASDFETLEENHQDMEMGKEDMMCFEVAAKSNWAQESDERTSLLKEKITMDVNHSPRPAKRFAVPQPACVHLYPRIPRRQFFFLVIASVAICCGLCLVFLHPHKMEEFAISVRRCLFGKSKL